MENAGLGKDQPERGNGSSRPPGPDRKYFTVINGVTLEFSDPTPRGKHLLDKGGCHPTANFVLIQVLPHSSRSIGLDETVDLRAAGTEIFYAEESDRIFRFTVNGHGYEWGRQKIPEPELRGICRVQKDEVIVIERDGDEIELGSHESLDLGGHGTEQLFTERRMITVFFDNAPRELSRGTYTTEQLKQRFGVQNGYDLEVINEEGQLMPLLPDGKLRVKNGMKFFEQVPCGGSS